MKILQRLHRMSHHPARFLLLFAVFFLLALSAAAQERNPVPLLVLVTIDGLRPDYVTSAGVHGAKIPNLRRFLADGAFAEGVVGVIPTVTYPSHTTLVTGVSPAKHGIYNNLKFDPLQKNDGGWFWYSEDIRVPTLWDVAAAAGRTTASVQWPATVGAHITWNIPEYWRANTPDDEKLLRAVATPGLLAQAQMDLGPYKSGIDTASEGDEVRGRYAVWLLEKKHPQLLTLHLTALDHIEHETGPFSPESIAILERLDTIIGALRAAAERLAPGRAYVAVASDHGFVPVDNELNLFAAFQKAGLFTDNEKGKTADWRAMPWINGGAAAIVLKDPRDSATLAQVRDLLEKLAPDPANGIDRILDATQLHDRGGFPSASFFVGLRPGWKMAESRNAPLIAKIKHGGAHGSLPDLPDLRAAFFLVGPGVPAGHSLGIIDMRDVAPTLAARVGLTLPAADGKNLLP